MKYMLDEDCTSGTFVFPQKCATRVEHKMTSSPLQGKRRWGRGNNEAVPAVYRTVCVYIFYQSKRDISKAVVLLFCSWHKHRRTVNSGDDLW